MKKQKITVLLALAKIFQTAFFGLGGAAYIEMQSDSVNVRSLIILITLAWFVLTGAAALFYFAYKKSSKKR